MSVRVAEFSRSRIVAEWRDVVVVVEGEMTLEPLGFVIDPDLPFRLDDGSILSDGEASDLLAALHDEFAAKNRSLRKGNDVAVPRGRIAWRSVNEIDLTINVSMFVLDGGPNALLPSGSGGSILAGGEAVFVAGRVACDAPTRIRVARSAPPASLALAYSGWLSTPDAVLRVSGVDNERIAEMVVDATNIYLRIYLDNQDEPDEIFVQVGGPG